MNRRHLATIFFSFFLIILLGIANFTLAQENTDPVIEVTEEATVPVVAEVTQEPTLEATQESTSEVITELPPEATTEATTEPTPLPEPTLIPAPTNQFGDDFQDSNAMGWALSSGWQLASDATGNLFLSASTPGEIATVHGVNWAHMLLSARLHIKPGDSAAISVRAGTESYMIVLDPAGQASLYRSGILLAQGPPASSAIETDGTWRTLNLQLLGDLITVGVDGTVQFSYSDPAPLAEGTISFSTGADNVGTVGLDDVTIIRLDAPTSTPPATETPISPTVTPTPEELPAEPVLALLISSDFNDGLPLDWTLDGNWSLVSSENGQALQGVNASAMLANVSQLDSVIQARLLIGSGSVRLGTQQSQVGGYTAILDANGVIKLYRAGIEFASTAIISAPDQWHTLRLSSIGGVLRVAVDGVEVIAVRDLALLPPGGVSFGGDGAFLVDDAQVWLPSDESIPIPLVETTPEPTIEVTSDVVEEATPIDALAEHSLPNLGTDLSRLYTQRETVVRDGTFQGLTINQGRVKVMLIMLDVPSADAAVAVLPALQSEVTARYETWIDAWVPVNRLLDVASLPGISLVRTPIGVAPIPDNEGQIEPTQLPVSPANDFPQLPEGQPGTFVSNIPDNLPSAAIGPQAISAVINSVTRDRCILTVTFTVGDAGTYNIDLWDDHVKIYTKAFRASRGQRITHSYTITRPVGQIASGYGIVISYGGAFMAVVDPYAIPRDVYLYCSNHVISQGVALSNANGWHQQGWLGSGVRVAVLDFFRAYTASQTQGELPPDIEIYGQLDLTDSHGTSVAEIIYDMAPSVEFVFASPQTATEMAATIRALADPVNNYQIDIISSSIGYYNAEPGDGTGPVSSAIEYARNQGVLYVQAAGNQANFNWQGQFRDDDGDGLHEFARGIETNELNGGRSIVFDPNNDKYLCIYLRWNAWPTTDQDYDLYLVRFQNGSWVTVDSSIISQTGTEPPVEYIGRSDPNYDRGCYRVLTTGRYGIQIRNFSADGSHILDLMGHNLPNFKQNMTDHSLIDPATSILSFGVAAVNASGLHLVESYSSRGPTMGLGGTLDTNSDNDQPRIAGYAVVNNWSSRDRLGNPIPFNGTSAAAPHVAGAAALVMSAYPDLLPGEVVTYLESRAIDMWPRGYDHTYGMGRLFLGTPPILVAPVQLTPINNSTINDATPFFSWLPVTYGENYEIQIATDRRFRNLVLAPQAFVGPSYTSTIWLQDRRYYWRVRALNSGFGGAWSAAMTFVVDTVAPNAPSLKTPMNFAVGNDTTPTFSWTPVSGANSYQLQIYRSGVLWEDHIVNGASYTPTPLFTLGYGYYTWRVRARDAAGNIGLWSATWTLTLTIHSSPANGSYTTDTTPTFRWYSVTGANFTLQVSSSNGFGTLAYTCGPTSATNCTPSIPLAYGIYYWRILVNGSVSPVAWTLTVTPQPPARPPLISPANGATNPSLIFTWSAVTGAERYEIQIDNNSNFGSPARSYSYNYGTSYNTSGLSNALYYWRVRAINNLGVVGTWSNVRNFRIR